MRTGYGSPRSDTPHPLRRTRRLGGAVAVCALALIALPAPVASSGTDAATVDILATRLIATGEVSVVVALTPATASSSWPRPPVNVSASASGEQLTTRVEPVVSSRSSVAVVLDASSDAAPALRGGALSGAANYLLRLPVGATTSVIADHRPPRVATSASGGVADAVRVISAWAGEGERATSDAVTLAVRQLQASPRSASPVIVLYTGGTPAGEPATTLAARLLAAGVILAVIDASGDPAYWSTAAKLTGGVAVSSAHPRASVEAFDALDDELQRRVVVTFPRPAAGVDRVQLHILDAGRPAAVDVDLPPWRATSGSEPVARAAPVGLDPGRIAWLSGGLTVALGAVAMVWIAVRRAPGTAAHAHPAPGRQTADPAQLVEAPPPGSAENLFRPANPALVQRAEQPWSSDSGARGDPPAGAGLDDWVRMLEELVAREPANPHHRRDLARGYQRLADRDRAEHRVALAASGYRQAVDALTVRQGLEPGNPQARYDLAIALIELADLDAEQGWDGQARTGYLQAIEICEALLNADPAEAEPCRQLLARLRARIARLDGS